MQNLNRLEGGTVANEFTGRITITCRRLRFLRGGGCPGEPCLKFLRQEFIVTEAMVALTAGLATMPEAWFKTVWYFIHDVELFRMAARDGR